MKGIIVLCAFVIMCCVLENCVAQRDRRCSRLYEVYHRCGTACPLTCDNYNNPPNGCIKLCVSGCFCTGNLIRDTSSGRCVTPNRCRK
uniref:Putative Protease inhibitor n=1 Tax=Megacormus gertschi TaxID=1843536 RepID=A0A224XGR5_9SCOR